MIEYIFGDDTFTARKKIHEQARSNSAAIRFVDKENIQSDSLEDIFNFAKGSLFGNVLLVIEDPSLFPEDVRERILEYCEKTKTGNIILWDKGVDKRLTFYKKIKQLVSSQELQQPKSEDAMTAWIMKYAPEISRDVSREVVSRIGFDVWAGANEADKLRALPHAVQVSDIIEFVAQRDTAFATAFPLLDAIVRKQQVLAIRLLTEMLDDGASERFILAMLAYQFRLFLAVRMGKDSGQAVESIHQKTGFHPIAIQKAMQGASRLSVATISEIMSRISMVEKSLITTTMDPRSIVTMLIVGLCR
ncbi:MAG: hypothetical protein O3A36_01165 [bacterium]|nr:hypothetical protein [bacterium]